MRYSGFQRQRQRGFTLMELLVSLLAASVTLTAVFTFFRTQTVNMRIENARRSAQVTARSTMNFMVRGLEQAGRDPQQTLFTAANPALEEAEADALSYRTNLNDEWDDADSGDAWEDVTFHYESGAIWVTQANGDSEALTDWTGKRTYVPVGGLLFTYFNADGAEVSPGGNAAARATIRQVRVSLTIRGFAPDGYNEPEVTLSQDVFLRNVS